MSRLWRDLALALLIAALPIAGAAKPLTVGERAVLLAHAVHGPVCTPSFTGVVANRLGQIPNATDGSTQIMSVSKHTLTDSVTSIQISFPNFWMNGADETIEGTTTFTAGVRVAGAGAETTVKWSASSSLVTSAGITPLSDAISLAAAAGAQIEVRVYRTSSTALHYYSPASGNAANTAQGEGIEKGTSGITDQTQSTSSMTDGGSPAMYLPVAIVATTTKQSVLLVGDSKQIGYHDTTFDATGDKGPVARGLGKLGIGYINLGIPGDRSTFFVGHSIGSGLRASLAKYTSVVESNYGINELQGSISAAQTYVDLQLMAAMFPGKRFIQSTIEPVTTSTDSWATVANQSGSQTTIQALNALILANTAGFYGTLDVAAVVADPTTHFWKAPPALTDDGIHEITAGNILVRDSGIFSASQFCAGPAPPAFAAPLDSLPKPVFAFSASRRLLSSYAGALMQALRSSDSLTKNIGFTATGDLDSSAVSSFVGGGTGSYNALFEQSNLIHATVPGTGNPPLALNVANGKAGMQPTAGGQNLSTASNSADMLSGDHTVCAVVAQSSQVGSFVNGGTAWSLGVGVGGGNTPYYSAATGGLKNDAAQIGSLAGGGVHLICAVRTSGSVTFYVDNVAGSTATGLSNASTAGALTLGGIAGTLLEWYAWAQALTTTQLSIIHSSVSPAFGSP